MTVPCVLAGLVGGASYFGSLEMDPTKPIFGVDPMIFFGGATFASMGVCYCASSCLFCVLIATHSRPRLLGGTYSRLSIMAHNA